MGRKRFNACNTCFDELSPLVGANTLDLHHARRAYCTLEYVLAFANVLSLDGIMFLHARCFPSRRMHSAARLAAGCTLKRRQQITPATPMRRSPSPGRFCRCAAPAPSGKARKSRLASRRFRNLDPLGGSCFGRTTFSNVDARGEPNVPRIPLEYL